MQREGPVGLPGEAGTLAGCAGWPLGICQEKSGKKRPQEGKTEKSDTRF